MEMVSVGFFLMMAFNAARPVNIFYLPAASISIFVLEKANLLFPGLLTKIKFQPIRETSSSFSFITHLITIIIAKTRATIEILVAQGLVGSLNLPRLCPTSKEDRRHHSLVQHLINNERQMRTSVIATTCDCIFV